MACVYGIVRTDDIVPAAFSVDRLEVISDMAWSCAQDAVLPTIATG